MKNVNALFYLIVDFNPSMFFGSRIAFKSVKAAEVAAMLAWATIKNSDQIGAALFSGDQHYDCRAKSRTQGVLPIMKALSDNSQPHPITLDPDAMANALARVQRATRPGSLVFIYQ